MKENDFYYYKAKKAVELINSDSIMEQNQKLPDALSNPDFHNTMCLYFLQATDDIRNCTDEDMRFKLRNDRVETLGNYLSILNTAMNDLNNYYSQVDLEFTDDNNGEDMGNYIEDAEYIASFIRFKNKYHNDPIFKEVLEDIIDNAHNYGDDYMDLGPRKVMENLQDNIKDLRKLFPEENMSYQDATILYARLNIYLQEMIQNANILANASLGNTHSSNTNNHRALFINKTDLLKLFKDFHKTYLQSKKEISDDELTRFEDEFRHFESTLFPYKVRCKYTQSKKVGLTTRELENTLLDLMSYSYENLINYIQFLLDNKIKLPLSKNKLELYPMFFIDFDTDTINKAFSVENSDMMLDMDQMRKILLTTAEQEDIKESLIHLEPKEPKIPIDPLFRQK